MNKRDLKKFEKLLFEERARLSGSVQNIEETSRNSASGHEHSGDFASYAEQGTDNNALETALAIAGAESDRIAEIDSALERIRKGTYGICEGSGKPIPVKRLEAFPAARYSIEHQEILEKEQRQFGR